MPTTLTDKIDAILPQTQCTKCGFAGCRLYAQAIATSHTLYNQCPPGGQQGVAKLAQLLDKPLLSLNPENGIERPQMIAVIDEARCIGCTLCIQACPVDAIIGAPKQMHSVINDMCTGCDLCIAPCPVDCITMENISGTKTGWDAWRQDQANMARENHRFKVERLAKEQQAHEARLASRT